MKSLIERLKGATDGEQEPCSENKCRTCFENRGCIYEQYAALREAWKVHLPNEMNSANVVMTKEMLQNNGGVDHARLRRSYFKNLKQEHKTWNDE